MGLRRESGRRVLRSYRMERSRMEGEHPLQQDGETARLGQ